MKIVHVTDCFLPRLGGIERQVHDLAVLQMRLGHDVQVVTSSTGAEVDDDEIPVRRPAPQRKRTHGDLRYAWSWQGRRIVLSGGFDVVHIHASAFSPLAFLTASGTAGAGIPTVVTLHSLLAYASPLFRAADAVTGWSRWRVAWSAVSSIAARPLQRIVGPTTPVTILPNGVDASSWRISRPIRRPGRIVVATVGRLAARKRPLPLLEMLRKARARLPGDIELEAVIVGEGPLRPSLERFVAHHHMGGWVYLPGPADHAQLRALYRKVDFYVAPATLESYGIAALEARSAGLPVVAYAHSGVAGFISHDVEGLLARDDGEMVASIVRLASSPATLERIRRHNTDHAPSVSWPGVADLCDALYDEARELAAAADHRSAAPAPRR